MRKSLLFITAFVFLTTATPLHARWIGELQRDYSQRLEKTRISRESIEAQRAAINDLPAAMLRQAFNGAL